MKKFSILCAALIGLVGLAAFAQNTLVYFPQGGASLQVASGGVVDIAAASGLTINDVAFSGAVRGGTATVSAGEDTANTKTITTGFATTSAISVNIVRSGKIISSDPAVSLSSGNIVVADGSTYVLTAADTIYWIAVGI